MAIVLLLQVHGRMSAAEIAERLETSERTIRRDLDSLCVAGVPVYPQRGRGGGWSLLGGHRIDLTGLTADEAQALLLAADSGSVTLGPGFADGLAAARRKLMAALPEVLRDRLHAAGDAVLIDRTRWSPFDAVPVKSEVSTERSGDARHLAALRRAVLSAKQAVIVYEPPGRAAEERRVHPHGLVCKQGVWYLVATAPAGLRTYRLSRMRAVQVTDEPVVHPEGFVLAEAWAEIQQAFSARVPAPVVVHAEVAPNALRRLRATVGGWWPVEEAGRTDQGWLRLTLRFPNARLAAAELVALGDSLEVVSPEEVRRELAALGRRLAERYGTGRPHTAD